MNWTPLAGSDDRTWADPTEDHYGLFDARSVTWRVHADPLLGLAGLRSLAMRALTPAGLASVLATSRHVDDLWDRLARSLRYVGVMTFGSAVEAIMAAARVRAIYVQIEGISGGDRFRGDDPEAVLWTHCCQVSSFLEVVRRGGLQLSDDEQDTYVREQVRTAALLGLDVEDVPSSRAGLARYLRRMQPHVRVTPGARALVEGIVSPSLPNVMSMLDPSRPAWAPVAGLAFAALPSWARRMYDLPFRSGPAALNPAATTVALHSLRSSLLERPSEP